MEPDDDTIAEVVARINAAANGVINSGQIYECVSLQPGEENSSIAWGAGAFLYYEHYGERTQRGNYFGQPFPGHANLHDAVCGCCDHTWSSRLSPTCTFWVLHRLNYVKDNLSLNEKRIRNFPYESREIKHDRLEPLGHVG